jgi:predicted Zn-dependent protease
VRRRAENYATRAFQLVQGKRPKTIEIAIQSTLGEVLLGLGRFQEAHDILDPLLKDQSVREHAAYNEVRWDLAQACACLARARAQSGSDSSIKVLKKRADALLNQVKEIELKEEHRPFSAVIDKVEIVCAEPSRRS